MTPTVHGAEYAQLVAFVAVAEQAGFSRAAEALGVTPSALSQTIRALEERLGVQLLNRTTRSVATTPAGAALLERLRPAMAEIGDAVSGAARAGGRIAGTVRVHAARVAAERRVLPMLPAFHAAHPDVVIDLTADDAVVDPVAGGFDLAIRPGEVVEKDMIAVRLGGEHRQMPVATPGFIARHGRPETPEALTDFDCIRWRWRGRSLPYDWEFHRADGWFAVSVEGPLILDDRRLMLDACLAGIGIAFLTDEEAGPFLADGRLVAMLEPWCAPYPGFFLCYPRQRRMPPAMRAFIDALRAASVIV
ncbi:MAG: LysR family transcriptional regulator [Tistrella sp.]|nr:LysR family transcriptional regulator [Tistrella sp.]MAD40734.1 LysR family transcriptional regulator [Tistrella sp.]MBA78792.1 LysR family transcriptional regulator [Tistrella sp.]